MTALYTRPEIPPSATLSLLSERSYSQSHFFACLTETNKPKHAVNKIISTPYTRSISELGVNNGVPYPLDAEKVVDLHHPLFYRLKPLQESITNRNDHSSSISYLSGTTYWFNEYLHVGHVHFNIGLMQVLNSTRLDRIVMQRAACYAKLCVGIGTFRSYWGAYFAAAFAATNHSHIPIYLRWSWTEKYVNPLYVSINTKDYEKTCPSEESDPTPLPAAPGIFLKPQMCFEHVIQRGPDYYGNSYGSLSSEAVQNFKAIAYQGKPLKKYPFTLSPVISRRSHDRPFAILVSYRGSTATRHIDNLEILFQRLNESFMYPLFQLKTLDNSDSQLSSEEQIYAMATANVLITNHGAFEGNLVYMRNGTLVVELSGSYYNPEFRIFQQLAQQFGLFYGRVQTDLLTDHQMRNFSMLSSEIDEVVSIVKQYFDMKPYEFNMV